MLPQGYEGWQRVFNSLGQADSSKATMKAIQVKQTGGPEVMELVDLPVPQPKSNEAVVKIQAAGVNFIDVYNREGRYKALLPLVLGQEAAGVGWGGGLGARGGERGGCWWPWDRTCMRSRSAIVWPTQRCLGAMPSMPRCQPTVW